MARPARIDRFLLDTPNVLAARGSFDGLLADYLEHSRRWVGEPDGLVGVMMRQGLAAAALYLTCRPRDELTAWTINFPEPPLNLFVAADAGEGRVTGRYFEEHVRSEPDTRLFVQLVRQVGEPHTSMLAVTGFDILAILEQYYRQSEQASARFFERGEMEFVMLMALPEADEAWLAEVTPEAAVAAIETEGRRIEQRAVRFACSCTAGRVAQVTSRMFHDREEELFAGDPAVEVRCPRCGHAYSLTREAFRAVRERRSP